MTRPVELAETAAEAVRGLNHATTAHGGGLVFPSDAYDVLTHLAVLAARLPQALGQVQDFLDTECDAGRVVVVAGEHVGDPVAAVTTTAHFTETAVTASHALHDALQRAAQALTWAAAVEDDEPVQDAAEALDGPGQELAGPEGI